MPKLGFVSQPETPDWEGVKIELSIHAVHRDTVSYDGPGKSTLYLTRLLLPDGGRTYPHKITILVQPKANTRWTSV